MDCSCGVLFSKTLEIILLIASYRLVVFRLVVFKICFYSVKWMISVREVFYSLKIRLYAYCLSCLKLRFAC